MTEIVHTFDDGVRVEFRSNTECVLLWDDQTCVSAFFTDPARMANIYTLNIAQMIIATRHLLPDSPILHFGGAGLSVVRGLCGAGHGPHTVVELNTDRTRWLTTQYPIGGYGGRVEVHSGDARDHVRLAERHAVIVVDIAMGAIDAHVTEVHKQLLAGVAVYGDPASTLVITNLDLDHATAAETIATVANQYSGVGTLVWCTESLTDGGRGNALIVQCGDTAVIAALADHSWDGWQRMA